jgi:hypothetical protein
MLKKLALLSGLLLSACTGTAVVPTVTIDTPIGMKPMPGSYAATIQSGGWDLRTKNPGMGCSAWSFDTNINPSYEKAMRDVMTRSLEKVDFTANILSPSDLKAKGYTAQVIVQQGNADSDFTTVPSSFTFSARSDVSLSVIIAIRDENGVVYQDTVTGQGFAAKDLGACPSIGESVGAAAQDAVRSLVKDIVLRVRDGLNNRQLAGKPTK